MHLIIGGAWQGKLRYAIQQYELLPDEIHDCSSNAELDMNKRCFDHFERYLCTCADDGLEPRLDFSEEKIIICQDIFCGIVSVDPKERKWRELAGRTVTEMALKADTVTRIFCGLPTELK